MNILILLHAPNPDTAALASSLLLLKEPARIDLGCSSNFNLYVRSLQLSIDLYYIALHIFFLHPSTAVLGTCSSLTLNALFNHNLEMQLFVAAHG